MKFSQIPRRQGYGDDATQRNKSGERLERWQSERHFAWMDQTGLTGEGLERRLTLRETYPTPQLHIAFLCISCIYIYMHMYIVYIYIYYICMYSIAVKIYRIKESTKNILKYAHIFYLLFPNIRIASSHVSKSGQVGQARCVRGKPCQCTSAMTRGIHSQIYSD